MVVFLFPRWDILVPWKLNEFQKNDRYSFGEHQIDHTFGFRWWSCHLFRFLRHLVRNLLSLHWYLTYQQVSIASWNLSWYGPQPLNRQSTRNSTKWRVDFPIEWGYSICWSPPLRSQYGWPPGSGMGSLLKLHLRLFTFWGAKWHP